MNFNELLKEKTEYVNSLIESYLPEESGFQKTVIEAMNYSLMVGGKRIRPILIRETFNLFAQNDEYNKKALELFMVAMEMIHTYSLVHDDLPAMDDDEMRRGKPTTHTKYGHAMGILAGDGLLNYAYEMVSKAFCEGSDIETVAEAFKVIARKPGVYGMLGGQAVDVELTGKKLDKETLDFIYELKTGALIEASMMIGAILAGANKQDVKKIEKIASNIGLAFQIQDDILDVISTDIELGKPINSDEKNSKVTYVNIYGIEKAKECVKFYSDQAIESLDSLDGENPFLRELIIKLISRKK